MRSSEEKMKFDCDLYMDLMPLVKDGAASDASRMALEDHMRNCPLCRELYDTIPEIKEKTGINISNETMLIKNISRHFLS